MRLELGCGLNPRDGFVHHDKYKHSPWVDVAHDLDDLPWPWEDESCEEIVAYDVVEHLRVEVEQWLGECWRILKPNGVLRLRVPHVSHENAWTDPKHKQWFTLHSFDYWDPRCELYQRYGCLDHARDGRLWHIVIRRFDQLEGNLYFVLRKIKAIESHDRLGSVVTPHSTHAQHGYVHQDVSTNVLNLVDVKQTPESPPLFRARQEREELEPRIKWIGNIFNFSGYAYLSRQVLSALNERGVILGIADLNPNLMFLAQFDTEEAQNWQQLIEQRVSSGVFVCFHPPVLWDGTDFFASMRQRNPGFDAYIGITMFETDRLPAGWAEACNGMDEVWVPSAFNRETFVRAGVHPDRLQVIPFGIDAQRYDPDRVSPLEVPDRRGFVFLSLFQWSKRKGWDVLLKAYLAAFCPEDDVCLVLRTYPGWKKTPPIRERMERYVRELGYDPRRIPPIILLEDFIPEKELPALYAAADAFVLPTRGEGWGIPFMEAMAMRLPVIATRWSAHLDFMHDDNSYLIDIEGLVPVDPEQTEEDPFYTPDHRWAEPSVEHTATLMRHVYEHQDEARAKGARAREEIIRHRPPDRTADWIIERVTALRKRGGQPSAVSSRSSAMESTADRRNTQYAADSTPYPIRHPPSATRHPQSTVLWNAPLFDPSGYADEAREFVLGLDALGVRVRAVPLTWSEAQAELPERERERLRHLTTIPVNTADGPVISVFHIFPPYFRRVSEATYHIGRTMFETDRIPEAWVVACNQMDEIWVPSDFNLETFARAGVERDKLIKMPGGIDVERFRFDIPPIPIEGHRGFNFLSVFDWTWRKGWDVLLRAFIEEFRPDEDVALILKVWSSFGRSLEQLRAEAEAFLRQAGVADELPPNVVFYQANLPLERLPGLYRAADAFVLPTRGEGWGRPFMEAMLMGLPVIGTRWSGHLEFMNDESAYLLDCQVVDVPEHAWREVPAFRGHRWAEPSVDHLRELMRCVFENPADAQRKGRIAREHILTHYRRERVAQRVSKRLSVISERLSAVNRQPPAGSRPPSAMEPTADRRPPTAVSETRRQGDKGTRKLSTQSAVRSTQYATGNTQYAVNSTQSAIRHPPSAIRWEGSQFVHHSLALVNRELCLQLIDAGYELSIIPYEPDQFGPEADPRFQKLAARVHTPLSRPADVHVRHQWPPNFTPPPEGRWVIIQPWEFGSLPKQWVEVMSTQVDEIWVPSHYVRDCYIKSGVPADCVYVVPNGVDPTKFHPDALPLNLQSLNLQSLISNTQYRFLFVGGTIHRKGIDLLLQAYLNAFTPDDDVCLVIKDMGGRSFYRGQTFEREIRQIQATPEAPPILYLDQDLLPDELPGLYTACDCLVHPYRGEGFGLPIAEAMACGRPVIVTGYGAALDFCDPETAYLIPAVEKRLPQRRIGDLETVDYPWLAEPDMDELARLMRYVYEHREDARLKGILASERIRSAFTWKHAAQKVMERLEALVRPQERPPTTDGRLQSRWLTADGRPPSTSKGVEPMTDQLRDTQSAERNTHSPDDLMAQANAAVARGDLAAAARALQECIDRHPTHVDAYVALASVAGVQGDYEQAQRLLLTAIALDNRRPELFNQLGCAYFATGKTALAENAFRKALELVPGDVDAVINLAEVHRRRQDYAQAARLLTDALQKNLDDVNLLVTFARLSLDIDEPEAARVALERARGLDPTREDVQELWRGVTRDM